VQQHELVIRFLSRRSARAPRLVEHRRRVPHPARQSSRGWGRATSEVTRSPPSGGHAGRAPRPTPRRAHERGARLRRDCSRPPASSRGSTARAGVRERRRRAGGRRLPRARRVPFPIHDRGLGAVWWSGAATSTCSSRGTTAPAPAAARRRTAPTGHRMVRRVRRLADEHEPARVAYGAAPRASPARPTTRPVHTAPPRVFASSTSRASRRAPAPLLSHQVDLLAARFDAARRAGRAHHARSRDAARAVRRFPRVRSHKSGRLQRALAARACSPTAAGPGCGSARRLPGRRAS